MTDSEQPFLSRRERREAERVASGESADFVAEQSIVDAPLTDSRSVEPASPVSGGGIPSRKDLRRLARETGVIPMLTAEMLDQAEKGILDIEDEIRHHTGTVPTLPADVVVGVDDSLSSSPAEEWPTGSITPMSSTDNLDVSLPQWPSGSVPAIDDEVKKMEQRALTGDLTDVAEALAAAETPVIPPTADPIAAAWAGADMTSPRVVSFEDIIAPTEPASPTPVEPMNVDVELPVSPPPATSVYVEVEQSHTSAPVAPITPEPVAPAPAVAAAPVVTPEPIVQPEPVPVEAPVSAPEPAAAVEAPPNPVTEVPAASPEIPPAREGDWREQLESDNENEWVKNHDTGMGVMQSPTLQTLVVDSYHTGDITGPLNPTGEIFITGQIILDPIIEDESVMDAIDGGVEVNQPGIPRRASEALSIIGKPAAPDERKRIPSVGSSVAAGIAAFLGLAVVVLGLLAYFTDII